MTKLSLHVINNVNNIESDIYPTYVHACFMDLWYVVYYITLPSDTAGLIAILQNSKPK